MFFEISSIKEKIGYSIATVAIVDMTVTNILKNRRNDKGKRYSYSAKQTDEIGRFQTEK